MKDSGLVQGVDEAQLRKLSLRERLERERAGLERQLGDINRALSLLDRNPDTEELMNLIS